MIHEISLFSEHGLARTPCLAHNPPPFLICALVIFHYCAPVNVCV
jgi:hypothetical protein